jgi:hypothetical protein
MLKEGQNAGLLSIAVNGFPQVILLQGRIQLRL